MRCARVASRFLSSCRRLIGGLIALLLLAPVPVLAINFTGSWQAVTAVAGGPSPTAATFTDTTSGGQDDLFVNMGDYQGATAKATSAIVLDRPITVSSSSEAIDFAHTFASDFKQAGVDVAVAVFDSKGHLVGSPISFSQSTKSTSFQTISANQSGSQTLSKGDYILTVAVAYETNNKVGGWKTKSEHQFHFQDH